MKCWLTFISFSFDFRVNLANLVKKAMLVLLAHGYVDIFYLSPSREGKKVGSPNLCNKIALARASLTK